MESNLPGTSDEALLLQAEVAKLQRPSKRALDAFKNWFLKSPKLPLMTPATWCRSANHLRAITYLYCCEELSRDGLYQIGRFNETSITVAVAIISILVASFLLIGSIVGLYFAKNNAVKLALVAAFTAVFAISVGLMTNARRAEIFAATAAYAAVLVVFISGDISKTQNTSEA